MCQGTSIQTVLALSTTDGANELTFILGEPVEIATFDNARVSWNLFDSTGLLDVQAYVLYGQEPLAPTSAAAIGSADNATGLHVTDIMTPDSTYRYAIFALRCTKNSGGSPLTVETGSAWAQVEYR